MLLLSFMFISIHIPPRLPGSPFLDPSQLSVACSTEKRERPGIIYHVSDVEGREKVERT